MKNVLLCISILFLSSANLIGQELVSRGKPVTASRTYTGSSPAYVTDGNTATFWNSGGGAPKSVQIDLQNNYDISSIKLNPQMTPSGKTVQKIYVSEDLNIWREIDNFTENNTTSGIIINRNYNNLLNIRGVKVETVSSPSWVAWGEIEIFGTITNIGDSNSNQNSVNIYEPVKIIDCYTKINPEIFIFSDKNLAFVKISDNVFSLVSTQDLQEKNIFSFKEKGIISLGNSYMEGNNVILLAIINDKREIKEYAKYNLSNFSYEKVKCKNTPRGCIVNSASANYMSLQNDKPYDFGNFKIFFKSNGSQYFYNISKIIVEKTDFNNAIQGNRTDKLDFLKKYPNSEYKNDVITSFINSFTKIKDISDFIKTNNEFNSQLDERAFIIVKNSNSESELQEYISVFPNGKFLTEVNKKISSIKEVKIEEEKRIAAEIKAQQRAAEEEREREKEYLQYLKDRENERVAKIKKATEGDMICYVQDRVSIYDNRSYFLGFHISGKREEVEYKMMIICFIEKVLDDKMQIRVGTVASSNKKEYATPIINGVEYQKGDIIWIKPLKDSNWFIND